MMTFKKLAVLIFAFSAGLSAMVSCDKDEKEDDSKSFTMTANLPEDTAESDAVYIVGEFNGGEEYALGNPKWELKGTATKRSITIDPKDFVGGKTLDDYWCIQSTTRGVEVVSPGVPMLRQGKSKEINVVAWEKAAGPSFDPSGVWTVVGTINDWNEKVGIEMTHEGSTWVVKGLHLRADDQFKFVMDGSWATNFGAGAPGTTFTAELNEEFDVQADGGNIKAAAGYYDIYLYPFEAKAKLVDGGDEPGPEPKPVTSVAITPSHAEMQVGDTWIFTFAVTPSDAEVKSFRWESSNPSVATVDQEGLVSAVGVGEASISVTVDGCTTDVLVTVTEDVPPQPTEGPTVYIYNATGWETIYLYGWIQDLGDVDNTPWPGLGYSNFEVFNGHAFFRFDLNENWSAGEINLIFNNGNEAQTPSYPISMTGGQSYFFYVKAGSVEAIDDPNTFDPGTTPDPGEGIAPGTDPTNAWSVIGHLMGTDWDTDLVMTETASGVWEVDITYAEGDAFKLRFNGSWDTQAGMWGDDPNEAMDITFDYGLNGDSNANKDIRLNAKGKMRLKFTTSDYKLYVTKLD